MQVGILITVCASLAVLGIILHFEKSSRYNAKLIAVIATTAALAGAFRIPFAFLPNIQPTTFIVMTTGFVFGPGGGFMTGIIATLVSNTFLGHGPWTLWQAIAWGLAGGYGGLLGAKRTGFPRLWWVLNLFIWGFIFDYIMNIWHFIYFIYPHTLRSFIAVYGASFFFDLSHGMGNALFGWFFGEELVRILIRYKNKLTVRDCDFERHGGYEENKSNG